MCPEGIRGCGVGWKWGVLGYLSGILRSRGRGTATLNISPPSPECCAAAPIAVGARDRVRLGALGPFRSPEPEIPRP